MTSNDEKAPLLNESESPSYINPDRSNELNPNTLGHGPPKLICAEKVKNGDLYSTWEEKKALNHEEKIWRPNGTTNLQTLMHVIKGNIGPGLLTMPSAIKNAGLWVGTIGILFMGGVATYCMQLLVECSRYHCKRTGKISLDYGMATEEIFKSGPQRFRKLAKSAKIVVNVFLCIAQLGTCSVYVLFVSENIKQIVDFHQPEASSVVVQVYEAALLSILIPLALAKNLKFLAPFSALANFMSFICIVIILVYCMQDLPPSEQYPGFASWETFLIFFGMVAFAFGGVCVVLPIENEMKHPEDYAGFTGVQTLSMTIVTTICTAVGFYGYIRFGDSIEGSITLNLPLENWIFQVVRIAYATVVMISYGLQFYVPVLLIQPLVILCGSSTRLQIVLYFLVRLLLVLITFIIAASVPQLDLVTSLTGACSASFLAFILPPILHIITFLPIYKRKYWPRLVGHVFVILFGIFGFTLGTYSSVNSIIKVSRQSG